MLARLMPLYVVVFFGFLGYSIMLTLFTPLFMYAQDGIVPHGASQEYRVIILGLLIALFPLAQLAGAPFLGTLSDRFGRRPILLISLYFAPLCYALIAYSLSIHSLSLLMVACVIAGATQSNVVIAQCAIADIAPEGDRSRLFGYIYLSSSIAFIVGPLIGGKLADPSLVSWFSYATPFWIVCALLVFTLVWTQLSFTETKVDKELKVSFSDAMTSLASVFTSHRLRMLYAINFLMSLSIFGFFRCYPMYIVNEFHADVSHLSEYIAWVSVPIILVNVGLVGYLSKHISLKLLTLGSSLFTGLTMLLITIPDSPNALWITLFLTSAGIALSLPTCATLLSLAASPHEQGKVMGNNQSLQVAAEAIAAVAGGLLASITVTLSLTIFGLLACATAALIVLNSRHDSFKIKNRTDVNIPRG